MSTFAAVGVGLATFGEGTGKVLDTWYPFVTIDGDARELDALARALGHGGGNGTTLVAAPAPDGLPTGDGSALAEALAAVDAGRRTSTSLATRRTPVVTFLTDLQSPPTDAHDVYLRLHLLSNRLVPPHGTNLEGAFGRLNNVVWTDRGPCDPEGFDALRLRLAAGGEHVRVTSVDKFPRMTDYVIPAGVRIADADRVRLGAHLGQGTTVMHEGFVNFNAGTLGASMVEGRISAGVVVGDGSDVGGGASIMGTLSGGGSEVISVGRESLIGANAGIGISLGDGCIVEAGLYITAGTKVARSDGTVVKARELSGQDFLLFRRDSQSGRVVVLERDQAAGDWAGLNTELHANQ